MDAALALGIMSIVVAVLALGVSGYLTRRQALAAQSQAVITFAAFLAKASDRDFVSDVDFVCEQLRKDVPDPVAVSRLPSEAKARVERVVNYFDQVGLLIVFRALDEGIVIGYLGNWLDQVWRVLAPYVAKERERRRAVHRQGGSISGNYLAFYEDLVVRTRTQPPPKVQQRLRLSSVER